MMPRKSLIKGILSLMLVFSLVLTTVTIVPKVALADNTSNTALEALQEGIEFYEQGDLANAESSYQEAIRLVTKNDESDLYVFIASLQYLAQIRESQGNTGEAEKLNENADEIIDLIDKWNSDGTSDGTISSCPGKCRSGIKPGYEQKGLICQKCPIPGRIQ